MNNNFLPEEDHHLDDIDNDIFERSVNRSNILGGIVLVVCFVVVIFAANCLN